MMSSLTLLNSNLLRPTSQTINGCIFSHKPALPTSTLLQPQLRSSSFRITTRASSDNTTPDRRITTSSSATEANQPAPEEEEEANYQVLTHTQSKYNRIIIVETEESKFLLLDETNNIHSMLHKNPSSRWTKSYWDEFVALPAVVPSTTPGQPIAMLGLGCGTGAQLMLDSWPHLQIQGWELDAIVIDKAREYFELSELEKPNNSGGIVEVRIGDALSESARVDGGYAGIVVDLFCDGKVLAELESSETWTDLYSRLMPNGRIMVNCGGISREGDGDGWERNAAIVAMCRALGEEEVNWKKLDEHGNYLALTGKLPDLNKWASDVPDQLNSSVKQWQPCLPKY